jgi:hypothetical protein
MTPLAVGLLSGTGLLTGLLGQSQQAQQAKMQTLARAAEQEAAPWTGQQAQTAIAQPQQTAAGAGLGGALSGFQTAQSMQSAQNQDELRKMLMDKMMTGGQANALQGLGLGQAQTLMANNMSGLMG